MKPVSDFLSNVIPAEQGFSNANCSDFSERAEALHSLNETAGFETFRMMLMDMESSVDEDELLLQLRTEAQRLLPCDKVCLALSEDGFLQLYEKRQGRESAVISVGSQPSIWITREAKLISEDALDEFRHASGVQAPFRIGNNLAGTISFLANSPSVFRKSETHLAQAIADWIGLLLTKTRKIGRTAQHEKPLPITGWKDQALRAVCEAPDIHRILPQLSTLLHGVIPHDRLTISFHDKDRNIAMRSASNDDGPSFDRFQIASKDFPRDGTSVIINDLVTHQPAMEPFNFHSKVTDAGYRSFLVNHVWGGQRGLGVVFWSKRFGAFHGRQVADAQRITDFLAVADSRESLIPEVGSREESTERSVHLSPVKEAGQNNSGTRRQSSMECSEPRSPAWSAVLKSVKQVASTDTTVLLVGETGTGKEVVARLIYSESARKTGPFVAVNCAALPDSLLESELFGFERGAFTGAYHTKRGQIELANRGVLFLDELSEMSLSAQAKLLRVLETRQFQPLGGSHPRKVEIRVIGATNKTLREEIRAGRFREDLYYRLCVFEISLPPLRSRQEDVLPLAYQFISDLSAGLVPQPLGISPQAQDALSSYRWPGNVRELRNVIERASILSDGGTIDVQHLKFQTAAPEDPISEISAVERKMIERALRECSGNKARAARMLGLSRTQLYVRLRRYGDSNAFLLRE